ncbi:MAG TPA: mechanosensitive ion channel [Gemmatimonadaceae bacterium]|nr:mechanosensitive ion channel [Gemmatimonadaceae bacterium]
MDFLERVQNSFLQLADYVPALVGALVILFAGYLLAKLIERGVDRLLSRLGLNRWLERGGVLDAVERTGWHRAPSRLVATIVFWFVMFSVILLAANALGLSSLANVFEELVSYIPSVIAAVVIVLVGIVLGEFVDGLIMASAGGIHGGPTLARVGRGGVIVLAIFMALQELGVATEIVTTAFAIVFGALALAFALSFGLGNRELAGEVTRQWYERLRAEREAIEREAEARERREEEAAAAERSPGPGRVGRISPDELDGGK